MKGFRTFTASAAAMMVAVVSWTDSAEARRGQEPASRSAAVAASADLPAVELPSIDAAGRRAATRSKPTTGPLRIAEDTEVNLTPFDSGTWETTAGGDSVWRLRVVADGATDLSFGFSRFVLPPGATLHVSSETYDYYEGPYGHEDVEEHGQLWTPAIPGDQGIVELFVPAGTDPGAVELRLTQVARGFHDLLGMLAESSAKQGGCNIDTVCPEGDGWRDEIRSVARYVRSGSSLCTGTMIMDAGGTFRNFFLTAYHCGLDAGNAPTLVAYWNYEAPTCGALSGGSLAQSQTGSTFRASDQATDMALVELDDDPDPSFGVYYAGWDRSGVAPSGSVGIHHPNGDEKAISFNTDALTTTNNCIGGGGVNSHWLVDDWEEGTTEPGSSGSGIWDPVQRTLVGFLSGGSASCGNPNGSDCYGRFSEAWDGGSASTRLRDWLDPANTGALSVAGSDPSPTLRLESVALEDLCSDKPELDNGVTEPGEEVEILVELRSTGAFTNVAGTVTSADPDVTILDDATTWANFPGSGTAVSQTPLRIRIAPLATCLEDVQLSLEVTSNEGAPTTLPLSVPVGAEPAPGVPRTIPDASPAGVASTIEVLQDVTITDLDVRVELTHTYVGDLSLLLRSPAGTEVVLLDRPGYPASQYGCSNDDMNVTFNDASAFDLETHCAGTTPWRSGQAAPLEALAAFTGESTMGTWTLTVIDNEGGDTGTLVDWELRTVPTLGRQCSICDLSVTTTTSTTTTSTTVTTTSTTTTTTLPEPVTCGAAPASSCFTAARGVLKYLESAPGSEKLRLAWKNVVDPVEAADFGDPVDGFTSVALCLYDQSDALVADLLVNRAGSLCDGRPCWSGSGSGFSYQDPSASADGIAKLSLRGGAAGKSKALVAGRNNAGLGQVDLPTGVTAMLAGNTSATAQMITSDGFCLDLRLNAVGTAVADKFIGKAN